MTITPPLKPATTFGGSNDPHMWEVTQAVDRWWTAHGRPPQLCVALSGGADSLALTAGAIRTGARITALIIDHQLQEGSSEVAHRAANQARQLGCTDTIVIPLVVDLHHGKGMEAAAREARYAALEMMRGDKPVLLGHTQNDQAETLLLGLVRGSGPRALGGMKEWDDPWGRPLLTITRDTTRAACQEHNIPVWDDPHNTNPAFTRVRLRHDALPLLCDIAGGNIIPALARTAELISDDNEELDTQARHWLDTHPHTVLPVATLRPLSRPLRTRILRAWLHHKGFTTLEYAHLQAVDQLVMNWHGQGPVHLPGGGQVRYHTGELHADQPSPTHI